MENTPLSTVFDLQVSGERKCKQINNKYICMCIM